MKLNKHIIKMLNLSKMDVKMLESMKDDEWQTSKDLTDKHNTVKSTAQRSLKRLYELNLIRQHQVNLNNGGYYFIYISQTRFNLVEVIREFFLNKLKESDLNYKIIREVE